MEYCISFQKLGSNTVHRNKIVRINKLETLVELLMKYGYHIFSCYENAPKNHIKKVDLGGYENETEQSRKVC